VRTEHEQGQHAGASVGIGAEVGLSLMSGSQLLPF